MSAELSALLAHFYIAWEHVAGGGYRVLYGRRSSLTFGSIEALSQWAREYCAGPDGGAA